MYKDKKILGIVPARGGSKGINRKNLVEIHGKSLVQRVAEICAHLPWLDAALISTDDEEIRREGLKHGLDAPFARPASLSEDSANGIEVWRHAHKEAERSYGVVFNISILLEPTSPCRTAKQVLAALDLLFVNGYEAVVTVSPTDPKYHPLKQLILSGDLLVHYQEAGKNIVNRQELGEVYHKNGIAYIANREYLLSSDNIIGPSTGAFVIHQPVVNIDSQQDLEFANNLLT